MRKLKCKNADKYKAMRTPRCGCDTCWAKWRTRQWQLWAQEQLDKPRKLKTRLHFNRISMQRKDPRVWSAHNSHGCNQAEKLVIMHNGEKVAETVYNPDGTQPRAYFVVHGNVRYEGGVAIIEV